MDKAGAPVYKMFKDKQKLYMRMLAETLMHPQEIWEQWEEWMNATEKMALRRRYLAWWEMEGRDVPGLSVFEWVPELWWIGVTTFAPQDKPGETALEYAGRQRAGGRNKPGAASSGQSGAAWGCSPHNARQ